MVDFPASHVLWHRGGTPKNPCSYDLKAGDVRQHPVENQWLYNIVHYKNNYNNNKNNSNSDH